MSKTTTFYICRLCGYIYKGKPTGNCPACGAPVSSFVPYNLGLDDFRYKLLSVDLHPIATHFGVGIAVLLALDYFVVTIINPNLFNIDLGYGGALDFLALILPIFVGLTALLGYFDGKLRYKKIKTKFLMRKLWLACIYFAVSIAIPIFNFTSGMGSNFTFKAIEGVLIVAAFLLAAVLGMIGKELTCNAVPRGRELPKEG
ncbi:MAG TPA: hypothetical protein VKM55_20335 [Candidatus Lokiarchaeia archaeon]|nr:hypothetical protein [Candidatus Lokiarchaeia archaeon]